MVNRINPMLKNNFNRTAISLLCLTSACLVGNRAALAQQVAVIEADARMVANCKFLGSVRGFSVMGSMLGGNERAMKGALKKAAGLGATHIVWDNVAADAAGFNNATGKAYQCDPAALAAEANPPATPTAPAPAAAPRAPRTAAAPATAAPPTPDRQAVYRIANQSTVLIEGQAPGSGVIISRSGNTYYVLTAKHVIGTPDEYKIVTANGKKFPVDYKRVRSIANLDLAVVPFTSSEIFTIARLGNSEQISQGDTIFVSGWPVVGQAITQPTHQVTDGKLTGLQRGDKDGYEFTYNNATAPGMSGGPVFDANGRVIGIHGRAAGNQEIGKVGINLGIPIHLFVRQAPQAGLNLPQIGLRL
jgi:S1-C subfamily serine protease